MDTNIQIFSAFSHVGVEVHGLYLLYTLYVSFKGPSNPPKRLKDPYKGPILLTVG